jgi:hypothetical protein
MKKILFFFAFVLLLPVSAFASFPFDSPNFLPPPTVVNVQFNRMNNNDDPVTVKSGILDAIIGKLSFDIGAEGGFYKTISVKNQNFSADQFEGGAPEDGVFTLKGVYRKGQISAEWTYEMHIPKRKGWKFPDDYSGSGTFYTTQVITEGSGRGIIDGSMTRSNTVWKDNKMVDHKQEVTTEKIHNEWVAASVCQTNLCGCFADEEPTDSKARFNSVTNIVGYAHCNKSEKNNEWIPATPKVKLLVGDHISTDAESFAVLQFEDMTTFQMKPETEVIVKTPPAQETKLGLVSGHLWINFKKMLTNGTMEVEMGQAVAGIKGTTLVLGEENGVSSLKVIEGVVAFTSKETGKTVDVKAGETVSADFNGLTEVKPFDVKKESANWKTLDEIKKEKAAAGFGSLSIVVVLVLAVVSAAFVLKKKKHGNTETHTG